MPNPVIAIGLDAAATPLIERWTAEGVLPTLAALRAQGAYAPVRAYPHHVGETPWTTFHTGCAPSTLGYWSPIRFQEGSYDLEEVGAYDYQEFPPFYALGDEYRVAIFDAPQTRVCDGVNGLQVLAWGAHSPQTASESSQPDLLHELIARHGNHPALNKDSASIHDAEALRQLKVRLETGIARRSAICQDLLQRERWDLFLTVFDGFHSAGHYFWHLSDPNHPLHRLAGSQHDLLRDVFVAADRAIGEVIAKAPADASVVVFSPHGMEANVLDLNSTVFLPELLYRFSFPGHAALAPARSGVSPSPLVAGKRVAQEGWSRVIWNLTREQSSIKSLLKRRLPARYFGRLEPWFGAPQQHDPASPFRHGKPGWMEKSQPAVWFRHLWPHMKAFALPSFSDGYIRINLQGREPAGIVAPSEYDRLCNDLTHLLHGVVDARTGQPVVRDVIRTRRSPDMRDPHLPAADLVVRWRSQRPADVIDSPTLGRIGPVPFARSGGHNRDGFLLARGAGIPAGALLPEGRTVDLAATILNLMHAPIPDRIDGRSLIARESPHIPSQHAERQLA